MRTERKLCMRSGISVMVLTLALCVVASTGLAQWINQTIVLHAGWNAVFLEVQPAPADCDTLFADKPVESVWGWNRRFTSVQYVQDPNTLLPGQPDWLNYVPPTDPGRATVNLFTLDGGRPYLIKATSTTSVTIRGTPLIRGVDWVADSFNLAGFYVASNSPPTLQSYFAPSPAHSGQPVFRLSPAGTWQQVVSPSTTPLNAGECYWVRCSGFSTYSGPTQITFEQGRGLDFGRTLIEQTLRVKNTSASTITFTAKKLASGGPPNLSYPALAGEVPLSYWRMNLASNQVGWVALPASLSSPPIAPGAEWALRLAVRRADMTSFTLPAGYSDASYQNLLEVTDGLGSHFMVPVTAKGLVSYGSSTSAWARGPLSKGKLSSPDPRAGLWVGSVVLSNVNQAAVSGIPLPTASDFQFRLILHVDDAGTTRLLQQVVLAWTNGVYATNDQGLRQAVTPGRFALITDPNQLARFSGSNLRDGSVSGRRISSAAFGFRDPLLVSHTGNFGETNGLFTCTVALGFDDAVNPFKHRYHPDHNNLDDRYAEVKRESLDVTRQISFQFSTEDPDGTHLAGWGDNQLGGTYEEVITGVHKSPVHVQGKFRLNRAATVPVLNDGAF